MPWARSSGTTVSAPRTEAPLYRRRQPRGIAGKRKSPILTPAITSDGVVIQRGRVLLVERGHVPYAGCWALPGGFVEHGESTEEAVVREVEEETGLFTEVIGLVGVYSDPHRDERGHVVSVAYRLRAQGGRLRGGDDARKATWWPLRKLPPLAFDHTAILQDARRRTGRSGKSRGRVQPRPRDRDRQVSRGRGLGPNPSSS